LIAFGITKTGVAYPTMVKTSEFAIVDTVPTTWDATAGTNNATENVLGEMEGAIMDAATLGERMMIYGLNETWQMVLDGSSQIWAYHKIFSNRGAINTNCSVEVDRQHYVFGLNDIWKHDGTSAVSLCDERVREFIFNGLNVLHAGRCFVTHNKNLNEVYFSYVSGDSYVGFPGNTGANRQAVYHIPTATWSFDDLPFILGAGMSNLDTTATWATSSSVWGTVGGTWFDQEDSRKKVFVMVGDVSATLSLTESLYAFDLQGPGSTVAFTVDQHATKGWQLYRDGIDLDEIGASLSGYKLISSIYPQARLELGASPISFSFGSADYFNDPVVMSAPQTYDGDTLYRLDYNAAGRYLAMKITHADYHYVNLTGFDFELIQLGER
jgi:hypothetical protein